MKSNYFKPLASDMDTQWDGSAFRITPHSSKKALMNLGIIRGSLYRSDNMLDLRKLLSHFFLLPPPASNSYHDLSSPLIYLFIFFFGGGASSLLITMRKLPPHPPETPTHHRNQEDATEALNQCTWATPGSTTNPPPKGIRSFVEVVSMIMASSQDWNGW